MNPSETMSDPALIVDALQSLTLLALAVSVALLWRRQPPRVGVCGEQLKFGDKVSICDLPADHGGWHEVKDGARWTPGPGAGGQLKF